jgi:hypothetical protein
MTNGPTLPPQAYTREVLTIAFNWLQTQPESIKKLAQTPDALVGLYLRAQRYGERTAESDAPVSSQAFISDLKNLAEGLKQFDDTKDAPAPQAPHQIHAQIQNSLNHSGLGAVSAQTRPPFLFQPPAMDKSENRRPPEPMPMPGTAAPPKDLIQVLSPVSQAMIREVKHSLNLTSDVEVLNMLVAIAYKNVKNLLT